MRVLIHSQSLLGIGHERRTQLIARALHEHGLDTHLVIGGPSALGHSSGATLHKLPGMRVRDASFSEMIDEYNRPIDDAFKASRQSALASLFTDLKPDALILELFPFGRRMLRFELLPLLELAKVARCKLYCSLRDILVAKSGDKAAARRSWAIDLVQRHFDGVLVHGDPSFVPLDASFPEATQLSEKLRYTGLVAPAPPSVSGERTGVLVSAGGGAVGAHLLTTALAAARLAATETQPWTLIAGPNCPDAVFRELTASDHPQVSVLRSHPNLIELMCQHRVSVSQAGYNTVCDALATRTPTVLVPFSTASETEQRLRATQLAPYSAFAILEDSGLDSGTLVQAVNRVDGPRGWPEINLDGAQHTANLVASGLGR